MTKKLFTFSCSAFLAISILISTLLLIGLGWIYFTLPSADELRGCLTAKMNSVELCSTKPSYVRLNQLPQSLVDLLVLSEDSRFWTHQGFDFEEIQKSLQENVTHGHYKRGGSTLTQQLAKNLFLTKEKTLIRKFREALITIKMESTLSKKEILEKYLNVVQFGPGIYGVKAAAQFYFEKRASELDIEESAFLIMLLPNPILYSQSFFNKRLTPFAFSRINVLLKKLYLTGKITEDDFETARFNTKFMFNSDFPEWDELELQPEPTDLEI